jgi:hypothetical protein
LSRWAKTKSVCCELVVVYMVLCATNLGRRNLLFSYLEHVRLLTLAQARLSPCSRFAQDLLKLAHLCSP